MIPINLSLILGLIIFFAIFCIACYNLYIERAKSVIIVDFDTFIVDMNHLWRRAEIYIRNNPNGKRGEYIANRIHEQIVRPDGIKEMLSLQRQQYPLFFITERHENLRTETVKVLNDWGISGPLYTGGGNKEAAIDLISAAIKQKGKKVFKILK